MLQESYAQTPIPRRRLLQSLAAGSVALTMGRSLTAAETSKLTDPIFVIERTTIFRGALGLDGKPLGKTWFSTRCGMIPAPAGSANKTPTALMLMAEITGSDYFWPVQATESTDFGQTWTTPTPVPGLGRAPVARTDLEATVCDMVPEYHGPTNTVLAMGHDVFYRGGKFFREQPPRHTVYIVRQADGSWSPLRRLAWDDPRGQFIYTCNCAQRVNFPDGDVLVPLSVGPASAARSVVVVRCAFDGEQLTVRRTSNELKNRVGRGLLEPSLAQFAGRYFMTIRAEDNHGYVSACDDGQTWSPQIAWQFDDGTPIVMSSTQQRWLVGPRALYLVYTRRDPTNINVVRWRAPLFAARVDPQALHLIRETERVVVPLAGDGVGNGANVPHLGNFHVNRAAPDESWITVGDYDTTKFRGNVTLARVKWLA